MNARELQDILRQHRLWLGSKGTKGIRTRLSGVDLRGVDLRGAGLTEAGLTEADLSRANLSGVNLKGAGLTEADLSRANLSRANLSGADLSIANLDSADLRDANLSAANLCDAGLIGTCLRGADLSGANLEGADLEGANLSGADLPNAHLWGADLSDADLSGADLSQARFLTQSQLDVALGDATTKIPADLTPPAHWPKTEAQPPPIPEQPLAPVSTVVSGDRVVLDDAKAESPTAPSDLELHRQELLDEVQHLSQGAGNHPQIRRVLERYREAFGTSPNELQEIRLGLRGLGLEELSKEVADLLPDDKVAAWRALALSHQIFMQQFPKWQEYISAPQAALSAQQSQQIEEATLPILQATREYPESIDPRIPDSIKQDHHVADESKNPEQRRGVFDSLRNLLVSVARLATKVGKSIHAVTVFLKIMGGGFDGLVEAFPKLLDWINAVKEYLQGSPPDDDSDSDDEPPQP